MKGMLFTLAVIASLSIPAVARGGEAASPPVPRSQFKSVPLYKLTAQQAAGLPLAISYNGQANAIIGDSGRQAGPGATTPKLRLLTSQPLPPGRLFHVQGEWSFTAERRFQQVDKSGNRLLLSPNGTADFLSADGVKLGALQDPALVKLYEALLKLAM